jgi:glycosyltransferase involved in cell wall biosynthesis
LSIHVGLAVDALSPGLTGIGRYCWELVSRLQLHREIVSLSFWQGNERVLQPENLLSGKGPAASPAYRVQRWLLRRARNLELVDDSVLWPRHHGVELFHGPNFMLPAWVESGVITVHDLSVFLFPDTHPAARLRSFERDFHRSLERAERIITPSQTVRRELAEFSGLDSRLISAVPMGVGEAFRPIEGPALLSALRRMKLPEQGYGLTVSALEPRKRIDRLLQAWEILPDDLRHRYPLVIAGASGWKNEQMQAQIAEAVAEGWAISLGYVAETDLPALYSGAQLFAYPSMYEGFGMPPAEAMACGVPVAVAGTSCLPEIFGEAAMLIDPEDIEGTATLLAGALTDETWRRSAVSKGFLVAGRYTWENCIAGTLEVYAGSSAAPQE